MLFPFSNNWWREVVVEMTKYIHSGDGDDRVKRKDRKEEARVATFWHLVNEDGLLLEGACKALFVFFRKEDHDDIGQLSLPRPLSEPRVCFLCYVYSGPIPST